MKTYTIAKSTGEIMGQGKSITEAMQLLPAGSVLVSGNKTEKTKKEGEAEEIREIIQATYKTPQVTYISIIEEK